MYATKIHLAKDRSLLIDFMRHHPFSIITTNNDVVPLLSHIPVEIKEENGELFLYGHVDRMNPLSDKIKSGTQKFLFVFTAGHSYVSASWYKENTLSTWNYRSVHAEGWPVHIREMELSDHLHRMMQYFEKGQSNPKQIEALPPGKFEGLMNAVTGFRVKVDQLGGILKLSQDRKPEDFKSVIDHLSETNEPNALDVVEAMKKLNKNDAAG